MYYVLWFASFTTANCSILFDMCGVCVQEGIWRHADTFHILRPSHKWKYFAFSWIEMNWIEYHKIRSVALEQGYTGFMVLMVAMQCTVFTITGNENHMENVT